MQTFTPDEMSLGTLWTRYKMRSSLTASEILIFNANPVEVVNEVGMHNVRHKNICFVSSPCQRHIEQSSFLCEFKLLRRTHHKLQHRVVSNLVRESEVTSLGVKKNNVITLKPLGFVNGHKLKHQVGGLMYSISITAGRNEEWRIKHHLIVIFGSPQQKNRSFFAL